MMGALSDEQQGKQEERKTMNSAKKVAMILGSDSDLPVAKKAAAVLKEDMTSAAGRPDLYLLSLPPAALPLGVSSAAA